MDVMVLVLGACAIIAVVLVVVMVDCAAYRRYWGAHSRRTFCSTCKKHDECKMRDDTNTTRPCQYSGPDRRHHERRTIKIERSTET